MITPRVGDVTMLRGTVRTVEQIAPEGHLRVTLDVVPPQPEVFEHLPLQQRGKTVESVCGKAWIPNPHVAVVGRCPECLNVAEGGWIA